MVAVYRVVNRHGETVAEYVEPGFAGSHGRLRAIRHAGRIGGRVFLVDEHGWLNLVFGARAA